VLHTDFQEVSTTPGDGYTDERWSLVLRIADSSYFCRSKKLRDFLLYVSRQSLDNAWDELKEQRIGRNVYGRRADYSPAEDNIVRVQAGLLRKKLAEYFAAEGCAEPVILTIPKGSYIPVFTLRNVCTAPTNPCVGRTDETGFAESQPAVVRTAVLESLGTWRLISVVLALACIFLIIGSTFREIQIPPSVSPFPSPLWKQLIDENHRTYVVCADAALALFQDVTHTRISLRDYASHDYDAILARNPAQRVLGESLLRKQYTGVADAYILQRVLSMAGRLEDHVWVRPARSLSVEDFKSGNFILVGSSRSTPWVELFEPELNFVWDYRPDGHFYIRNKHPQPTEQPTYLADAPGYNATKTYSIVAFLPNLNHTGNVLVLGGTSSIGTQAAGEYVAGSVGFEQFLTRMPKGKLSHFELVLESSALAGEPKSSRLVAYRILGPS
jgi:hypothetical protein